MWQASGLAAGMGTFIFYRELVFGFLQTITLFGKVLEKKLKQAKNEVRICSSIRTTAFPNNHLILRKY